MQNLISANGVLIVTCTSGLISLAGGLWMVWVSREPKPDDSDLEALIANAPYHLLDDILPDRRSRKGPRAPRASRRRIRNEGRATPRRRFPSMP